MEIQSRVIDLAQMLDREFTDKEKAEFLDIVVNGSGKFVNELWPDPASYITKYMMSIENENQENIN